MITDVQKNNRAVLRLFCRDCGLHPMLTELVLRLYAGYDGTHGAEEGMRQALAAATAWRRA